MNYDLRINLLREKMQERQLEAVLVTGRNNVFYLSGFTGTSGDLFITTENCYILTDFRYIEQSEKESPHFKVIDIKHGLYKILPELIQLNNVKSIGFEDRQVSYAVHVGIKEKVGETALVPLHGLISSLRDIKQPEELEILRKAAEIADNAFRHILKFIRPEISEIDIAAELEYHMRKLGATKASFDLIVASGERGAMPHGTATTKLIKAGELITLDFGCIYNGYCSDITRTVAIGNVTPKQREIYNIVHFAQLKALNAVKVGAIAKSVDSLSRNIFAQFGLDNYFGHSLGHGVGIDVHEQPNLNPKSDVILQEGMVVTVEPGLYLPGEMGVRIEDTVVVTKNSIEILTKSPKELLII